MTARSLNPQRFGALGTSPFVPCAPVPFCFPLGAMGEHEVGNLIENLRPFLAHFDTSAVSAFLVAIRSGVSCVAERCLAVANNSSQQVGLSTSRSGSSCSITRDVILDLSKSHIYSPWSSCPCYCSA